jgi:hypothetical protein
MGGFSVICLMQMDRFVFVGVRERAPRHACDVRGDFFIFHLWLQPIA